MHAILFKSDLVGYIEKPLTEHLNATTDEKEQQKHKKHDQQALGQMQMHCSAWALTFIVSCSMSEGFRVQEGTGGYLGRVSI